MKKNKSKTIGINSLFLIPGKVGGTEVFFRKQIEELSKIKTSNNYIIYANSENKNTFKNLSSNFKIVDTGVKATNRVYRIIWEQIFFPIRLVLDKVDLLHSAGYTTPLITHCPKITTIFDLNYHFHPEDFNLLQRIIFSILIPLSAYSSNKVVVHSFKAKDEMIDILKLNKNKIEVIYGGVPDDFKRDISLKKSLSVISKYNIKQPYILANATSHPHKNLKSLVVAFLELVKNKKFKHNLVLIGIHGIAFSEIDRLIDKYGYKDRIIFTNNWIDHSNMKYFNRAADIFVMPSLYEGFGLPTAEAMACGTPVIASKYSCTPEIVGDAGLIVDVKKPTVIADKIRYLLSNKVLRNKLAKAGIVRSNIFSWSEMGKKIYNLYNDKF